MRVRAIRREPRWLLCRPRGGLNDTLNQIDLCWRYARRFRRILVVDARWSGFLDRFDRYFAPRRFAERSLMDPSRSTDFEAALASDDPGLARQTNASAWDAERSEYLHPLTGRGLSFDLERDHPERIIVHERHGGGSSGASMLRRLRFTPAVAVEIAGRLSALPDRYAALHVRNTDLRSDHADFFESLRAELAGHDVLVASDDLGVRESATRILAASRVHWLSTTHPASGGRLHENPDIDRYGANTDALCDLIALARSHQLFICPLATSERSIRRSRESGFSRLARQLHEDRRIERGLMNRPRITT